MARDTEMVSRFAEVDNTETALLNDRAAPIVVLNAAGETLAQGIAPSSEYFGLHAALHSSASSADAGYDEADCTDFGQSQ